MTLALSQNVINLMYVVAAVGLILGIKGLSHPATARRGNLIAAAGMIIAIAFTFASPAIDSYWLIIVGIVVGTVIGAVSARKVKMTAMPQMVALFNGVGGGAAALIAASEFHRLTPPPEHVSGDTIAAIMFSALIGSISFSGSMVAFAKLQELVTGSPITFPGQQVVNGVLIAGSADSTLEQVLAFVAVVFATVNVVGGFLVTDRMLEMFKSKPEPAPEKETDE